MQIHRLTVDLDVHLRTHSGFTLAGQQTSRLLCVWKILPHHFLFGTKDTQLSEAHVERRALETAIWLSNNDDIDSSCERGRVQSSIQLFNSHKNRLCQLTHVIHRLTLRNKTVESVVDKILSSYNNIWLTFQLSCDVLSIIQSFICCSRCDCDLCPQSKSLIISI